MEYLNELGANAQKASAMMAKLGTEKKNEILLAVADELVKDADQLIAENKRDLDNAKKANMKASLQDRLLLTKDRIEQIAEGVKQVVSLDDPIGEVMGGKMRPNGLMIAQKRVPLGVIGIIFEARPNVTVDAFALCFKTGNATILRGGSDAIYSITAIVNVIRGVLKAHEIDENAVSLLTDTSHETAAKFMKLNQYIDVLIPRGGTSLIRTVVNESTIPVIETGTGNCHVYVDEFANVQMAVDIIDNAKTQRLGVCNACESLVIHEKIVKEALPAICKRLHDKNVEIRGDERARSYDSKMLPATEEDYGTEYLDAIISVKVVDSIDEAISHINKYHTKHSDVIVTDHYDQAQQFTNEIDSAAVYVNASSRFTDGFEFGLGAEIGISTQKLHARGPMGLIALTTYKYIILGNGQIRP